MTAAIGSAARNTQQCCSGTGSDKNRDCNAFSPTAHPCPGPTRGLGTGGPHTAQQLHPTHSVATPADPPNPHFFRPNHGARRRWDILKLHFLSYWSFPALFHGQASTAAPLSVAEQEATSLSSGMSFIWWHQFPRSVWIREQCFSSRTSPSRSQVHAVRRSSTCIP